MRYLIFLMMLTACGAAEQKRDSDNVKKKTPAVKAKINEKAIAAKAFINAPYGEPSPSVTPIPAENTTPVVVVSAPTASETSVPGMVYVSTPVNWADAIGKAPAGKRLATRDELFALWDNGSLKGLAFSTGVIWSASAKNSSEAWCLSTYDGTVAFSSMSGMLSAVYVAK